MELGSNSCNAKSVARIAPWLRRFLDIRPGEVRRVVLMAALLFSLLAANNLIKIVRDALFLSRFPIARLPYVYLLAALLAGVLIAIYARYTARWSFSRVVMGSLLAMMVSVVSFWLLLMLHDAAWVFYAYYIWSAIAGMVLVSQFWILANGLFTPRDGKRLFGIVTAGGTLGALLGGMAASGSVRYLIGSAHLLWLVAALLAAAAVVVSLLLRESEFSALPEGAQAGTTVDDGVLATLFASRYLKSIAAITLVSVVVSTLIDFQFKAAAKAVYPSADGLAEFFGWYYAWLGALTLAAQLWLSGKLLLRFGLAPSLLVLPLALLAGSIGLLIWPGLAAATAMRVTEATLRTSVNQSGVQILYLPVPDAIKKRIKVFLDVTVERLGDGLAALVILAVTLTLAGETTAPLSTIAIVLVIFWCVLILRVRDGYLDALRRRLRRREVGWEVPTIDFADRATAEALLASLHGKDEPAIFFALDLAEKLAPRDLASRLPPDILRHPSAAVRQRAWALVAQTLEPNLRALLFEMLTSESGAGRAEAIQALAARLTTGAAPALDAMLHSAEAPSRRAAMLLMLRSGEQAARQDALAACRALLRDRGPLGEPQRIEAARLIGEAAEPVLSADLVQLIEQDPAPAVVHESMAAAAKGKYPAAIAPLIACLGDRAKRVAAREALVAYGEMVVKALRSALSDDRTRRDVRLHIPAVLSKIPVQAAMNALMDGLLEEDRTIRFKAIVAVAEMKRRFPDLRIDREIVESALMSDGQLYARRLAMFSALFDRAEAAPGVQRSLLYWALREGMERVRQRLPWLLTLIYPAQDMRNIWSALQSPDAHRRGHAVELLDNLLTGELKKHLSPLYGDSAPALAAVDVDGALRALLAQTDPWLKAAAVWEIGVRKCTGFGPVLAQLAEAPDTILRQTAGRVLQTI